MVNPLFSFSHLFSIFVHQLSSLYCVVPEGFHTSLKPKEALIYLYDGTLYGQDVLPWICTGYGKCMVPQTATCEDNPAIGLS